MFMPAANAAARAATGMPKSLMTALGCRQISYIFSSTRISVLVGVEKVGQGGEGGVGVVASTVTWLPVLFHSTVRSIAANSRALSAGGSPSRMSWQ